MDFDKTMSFNFEKEMSAKTKETLKEADIENTDLLIACTTNDETNVLCAILGKKLGVKHAITRVRDPKCFTEINNMKEELGIDLVFNPELRTAIDIANVLKFPSAKTVEKFGHGKAYMVEFEILKGNPIIGKTIIQISKEYLGKFLFGAVIRDGKVIIPRGDFVLKQNDRVSIVSSIKNAADFFKKIGVKTNRVKDTIIAGGGSTAYYLAKILLQTGVNVKILEKDTVRAEELCEMLPKATIINGDGTDNRLLLESGLSYAESFVSLINIDEENILLSLFAKSNMKESGKVITKINRIAYDKVISSLDLDSIIYPKNITAEYIVRFVRAKYNSIGSNIETMHLILDGKAEALEFNIGKSASVCDIPLEKLSLRENLIVACINRNGKIIIPHGQDSIQESDTVIVVTTATGLTDIEDILK